MKKLFAFAVAVVFAGGVAFAQAPASEPTKEVPKKEDAKKSAKTKKEAEAKAKAKKDAEAKKTDDKK